MRRRRHDVEERIHRAVRSDRQRNAGIEQRLHRLHPGQRVPCRSAARKISGNVKCVGFCTTSMPMALTRGIRSGAIMSPCSMRGRFCAPDFRASASLDGRHVGLDRGIAEGVHCQRIFRCRTPSRRTDRCGCGGQIEPAAVRRRVRVRRAHEAQALDRRAVEDPLHAAHVDRAATAAAAAAACCRSFRRRPRASESGSTRQRIGVSAATSAFAASAAGSESPSSCVLVMPNAARFDLRIAGRYATTSAASVLMRQPPFAPGLRVFLEPSVQPAALVAAEHAAFRISGVVSSMPTNASALLLSNVPWPVKRGQPHGMVGRDRVEPRARERRIAPRPVAELALDQPAGRRRPDLRAASPRRSDRSSDRTAATS